MMKADERRKTGIVPVAERKFWCWCRLQSRSSSGAPEI